MTHFIISEGSPTAWGGRTVRLELPADDPIDAAVKRAWEREKKKFLTPSEAAKAIRNKRIKAARNKHIQAEYLSGKTGEALAHQFNLSTQAIYYILHAMNTPMRASGRRYG